MSRGRQYIQLEGYFAESVLGIFRIIRGFLEAARLSDDWVWDWSEEHS